MSGARAAPDRGFLIGVMALMAAMVSFQLGAMVAKGLFPIVGAEGAVTLRLVVGATMLVIVFRPWRQPLPRRIWLPMIGYGAAMGAMNALFYMSLRTVPLGIAVALEFLGPLAVATASLRRPRDFAWIVLAVAGLLLLLPLRQSIHAIDPTGAMLALGAGVFWALYILFGQKAGEGHGAQAVTCGMVVGALLIAPIGIAHAGTRLLDPAILPAALLLGAISSAVPYLLEMVALMRMPARGYGTLTSLEPAIGCVVGFFFLGETVSAGQMIGIAAVVAASIGTTITLRPPVTPENLA